MSTCKVHNVRFYKPEARAIHCMAYARKSGKLSVGRADSSIEIWDLSFTPHMERTIPATTGGSVEALAWYEDRLFGTGLHGVVFEYNLLNLSTKYEVPVTSGPSWCLDINEAKKLLAVGTEDGYINIFEIDDNRLNYLKLLDKQEGRILCLKWHLTGDIIVTGSSDSLRLWNVNSGHAIHRMTTGRLERNKETVVWCITITKDMTIISGDSRGCLTLWNGDMGTQIQKFKSHTADILCLSLSNDQQTVYCSGIDPVITSFYRIKGGPAQRWVRGSNRVLHDHDVRSLISADHRLISAGVDGFLAVSYPPRFLIKYPPILQAPSVMLCPKSRCLLLRYPLSIEVWRLGTAMPADEAAEGVLPLHQEPLRLLKLTAKGEEPIACAAMSQDSNWLAYSTATCVRFFSFTITDERPIIEKLTFVSGDCGPAHMIQFAPLGQYLVLASKLGDFHVVHMSDTVATLLHTFRPYADQLLNDVVNLMTFSPNGKYLVAADLKSNIAVWETDNWKYSCSLPRLSCAPTAMAIQPVTNNLVVVYADQKIIEFCLSPDQMKYTNFSRELDSKHPTQWLGRTYVVTNITFDPRNPNVIIMHDDNFILVVNKGKELLNSMAKIQRVDTYDNNQQGSKTKRVKTGEFQPHLTTQESAFHFIKKYKHLVYLGWLENEEMVAVEVSPLSLEENLPPTLKKKKFGMN